MIVDVTLGGVPGLGVDILRSGVNGPNYTHEDANMEGGITNTRVQFSGFERANFYRQFGQARPMQIAARGVLLFTGYESEQGGSYDDDTETAEIEALTPERLIKERLKSIQLRDLLTPSSISMVIYRVYSHQVGAQSFFEDRIFYSLNQVLSALFGRINQPVVQPSILQQYYFGGMPLIGFEASKTLPDWDGYKFLTEVGKLFGFIWWWKSGTVQIVRKRDIIIAKRSEQPIALDVMRGPMKLTRYGKDRLTFTFGNQANASGRSPSHATATYRKPNVIEVEYLEVKSEFWTTWDVNPVYPGPGINSTIAVIPNTGEQKQDSPLYVVRATGDSPHQVLRLTAADRLNEYFFETSGTFRYEATYSIMDTAGSVLLHFADPYHRIQGIVDGMFMIASASVDVENETVDIAGVGYEVWP